MSEELPRWQWLGRVMLDAELGQSAKVLAFWIAEHANEQSMMAWPSIPTLMGCTSLTERAVQAARKALVRRGWLWLVDSQAGPRLGARYALTAGKVHEIAPLHEKINAARRMWGLPPQQNVGGVQNAAGTGAVSCGGGVQNAAPKPLTEPPTEQRQQPRQAAPLLLKEGQQDADGEIKFFMAQYEASAISVRQYIRAHKSACDKFGGEEVKKIEQELLTDRDRGEDELRKRTAALEWALQGFRVGE